MTGVMNRFHHFGEANIHRESDHAGAGHHHFTHLGVPQSEHPFENVALVGEEAGDTPSINQRLKLSGR